MTVLFRYRHRPLVEHGPADRGPRRRDQLPDLRLPGGRRGPRRLPLEEGGRRQGPPAAHGVHPDAVPAGTQVPLCGARAGYLLEGGTILRAANDPADLNVTLGLLDCLCSEGE